MSQKMRALIVTVLISCGVASFTRADGAAQAAAPTPVEVPVRTSMCELLLHPETWNHKLVEVSGQVSQGFEDFTLNVGECRESMGIWLEVGGKRKSGTVYCCGVTGDRERATDLMVEGTSIPLVDDKPLKNFLQALYRHSGTGYVRLDATLVGRFFAGARWVRPGDGKVFWMGYGHMGCCSLLAIQQVISVK